MRQRSIGLAMRTLMLAATALGIQELPDDRLRDRRSSLELIHLPEGSRDGPMVAIGKGTQDPLPKPGSLALADPWWLTNGF